MKTERFIKEPAGPIECGTKFERMKGIADLTSVQIGGLYERMETKEGILWGGYKVAWRELSSRYEECVADSLKGASGWYKHMVAGSALPTQKRYDEAIVEFTAALGDAAEASKVILKGLLDLCVREKGKGRQSTPT